MNTPISIWAPHADDEIIGCSQLLLRSRREDQDLNIYCATDWAHPGLVGLASRFHFAVRGSPGHFGALRPVDWGVVLAPDPFEDPHPLHQELGHLALQWFRENRIERLIFYTTVMRAKYIFEVPDPQWKRELLEEFYPDKRSLWETQHKYFLFEGWCEWKRPGEI